MSPTIVRPAIPTRRAIGRSGTSRPLKRSVRPNLHIRAEGRANQRYALLFRDYLRAHPTVAAGYGELKRRLADYVGADRNNYVEIKDPVCDIITAAAEEWAAATGWDSIAAGSRSAD